MVVKRLKTIATAVSTYDFCAGAQHCVNVDSPPLALVHGMCNTLSLVGLCRVQAIVNDYNLQYTSICAEKVKAIGMSSDKNSRRVGLIRFRAFSGIVTLENIQS